MKIIDAHVHVPFWETTIFPPLAAKAGVTFSREGLRQEMEENSVVAVVSPTTYVPGGQEDIIDFSHLPSDPAIKILAGINPNFINSISGGDTIAKAETLLKEKKIIGFKICLGYFHVEATNHKYQPFYTLAQKYDVPVLFHTGDTLFKTGKIRYAHPLSIDELAVNLPKLTIVMAHLGNPWMADAAAVCYKNDNVFMDVSGLTLGNTIGQGTLQKFKDAYEYVDNPEKFLFGTDWPLSPMADYISYFQSLVPEKDHNLFFYENAKRVYKLDV